MRDLPEPALQGDHDVLIRVGAVGMCGSDIHYYTTGRIGSQVVRYPFVVGHEFGGTVLATGNAVTRVKAGDRVAVDPAMPCFACDQCRAGRAHTCRKLTFLGCPGLASGCLCERIVMPETSCFAVPAGFTDEDAALAEPLSIGCYAVRLANLSPGCRVAIQGCGPIGLSVLLAARQAGAARVAVSEPLACRRACALRFGADWAGLPEAADAHLAAHEPLGVDAVFECCGKQEAMDQALAWLKPGGKLMLIGIPEFDRPSFAIDLLRRKELCLQNVRRQNECVEAAIALLGRLPEAREMITHRFGAEQTAEAFETVAGYRDGVIKAMVRFSV
jgi:L-iditol 2-dehydrogenase